MASQNSLIFMNFHYFHEGIGFCSLCLGSEGAGPRCCRIPERDGNNWRARHEILPIEPSLGLGFWDKDPQSHYFSGTLPSQPHDGYPTWHLTFPGQRPPQTLHKPHSSPQMSIFPLGKTPGMSPHLREPPEGLVDFIKPILFLFLFLSLRKGDQY